MPRGATVEYNQRIFRSIQDDLRALPAEADRANVKALRHTTSRNKPPIVRQVAQNSDLPQKAVRSRVKTRVYRNGKRRVGRIWIGLSPVSVGATLSPSRLRAGYEGNRPVTRKGFTTPNSFYQKPKKRAHLRNPYATLRRLGKRSYPIRYAVAPIFAENIIELKTMEPKIYRRYIERFTQNLKYEISKRA